MRASAGCATIALARADGHISLAVARSALDMQEVDAAGLDQQDRRYLDTLIRVFRGGPTGVEALAATMNVSVDTLKDEVEPYLLRREFVMRSPRGRQALQAAYLHLGLPEPPPDPEPRSAVVPVPAPAFRVSRTDCHSRSRERTGRANDPITHCLPLGAIGRHDDDDRAQAQRVEPVKCLVERRVLPRRESRARPADPSRRSWSGPASPSTTTAVSAADQNPFHLRQGDGAKRRSLRRVVDRQLAWDSRAGRTTRRRRARQSCSLRVPARAWSGRLVQAEASAED